MLNTIDRIHKYSSWVNRITQAPVPEAPPTPAPAKPAHRRAANTFLWLTFIGVVLLACMLQAQYLLLPIWLEGIGRVFYKAAFFITLPFRAVILPLFPRVEHHYSLAHYVVTCLGAPFFLWGLWHGALGVLRLLHIRRSARRSSTAEDEINRRQFLARSAAGVVGVATGGLGSYASLMAPEALRLRRYVLPIHGLPAKFDGLRIVHVSDTHYGPFVAMPFLCQVFDRVNAHNPDLVLLTGDYVHYTPDAVAPGIAALARIQARLGVVAVMGNHEHWEGTDACRDEFRRIGLPLLDNHRLFLNPGGLSSTPEPGRSICLAGVGDLWEDEVSFEKAFAGVPEDMPRLLLSHNPDVAEMLDASHRVDCMFSGHTHGGQIALPVIGAPVAPSRYGTKYLGGYCEGPHCPVIVSRGVGLAGIPVRLGVPPELGLITLRKT